MLSKKLYTGYEQISSCRNNDEDIMHGDEFNFHEWLLRNVPEYREMQEYIPGNEDEDNPDLWF